MPFTLNGTGTKYLGEREHDIGGTYITTKWVVIFMIPIVPLSSWRVFPLNEGSFNDHTPLVGREASESSQAFHATRVPLSWRQVLNVYAIAVPVVVAIVWALNRAFPRLFA